MSHHATSRRVRGNALVAGLGVAIAAALTMPNAYAADGDLQAAAPGQAVTQAAPDVLPDLSLELDPLASATPDECFNGVGKAYGELKFDLDGKPSCETGQFKVNQAYVWGLAKSGNALWFGTGSDINCLATAQFIAPMTSLTDSYVCEGPVAKRLQDPVFAQIKTDLEGHGLTEAQALQVIGGLGDWRAPDLFTYDLGTDSLLKVNDQVTGEGADLLARTVGIRSAGAIGDFVIFAGPDAASSPTGSFGAVNFFVFQKGTYLGAKSVDGWTNIRKWVEFDGALYTGVATAPIQGEPTRGEVLKFLDATDVDPMQTEVVGKMTTAPSEFTMLNDRIYTTTWPVGRQSAPAGVWMSPALSGDGLGVSDADGWTETWNIADYEPDPVLQASTGIGAIEALDGHLFWGTMNVPFVGAFSHGALYASTYKHAPDQQEIVLMLLGGHRATSLFRASGFDTVTPDVELLYGNTRLPVAEYAATEPVRGASPVTWRLKRNEMGGQAPLYGLAGFGNPFNAYTWTMAMNRGTLYVGTFDYSYLISAMLRDTVAPTQNAMLTKQTLGGMLEAMGLDGSNFPLQYGADMWRFRNADSVALPEFINGADNRYSYGVRTIVSEGDTMYLGMANPMNLEVNSAGEPQGGWQLVKAAPWATQAMLSADPTEITQGETVRLVAGVRSHNGYAVGTVTVTDGGTTVGSCVVNALAPKCTLFVPGLTAGSHTLTAEYRGNRIWAASVSAPVNVTVNPPPAPLPQSQPPAASADPPVVAPAPEQAVVQVSARSAKRAVKAQRVAQLVKAPNAAVAVTCTVKGRVLTGKAARKACGVTVNAGVVTAKPTCAATRVSVTLSADAGPWTRTWAVQAAQKCKA